METIYCYQLKHNYLKTKHFSWNFYCIFRIYIKFWIFWNKMSFITSVFLKLWLRKTCLLKCIKGLVCENPLVVNVLMSLINWWNLKKILLSYFLIILSQLELENIFSMRSGILELVVNRLTANYEYSWGNGENLLLPTQMQLSEKLNIF